MIFIKNIPAYSIIFFLLGFLSLSSERISAQDVRNPLNENDKRILNAIIDSMYNLDQSIRRKHYKIDSLYGLKKGIFMFKKEMISKFKSEEDYESYCYKIDSIWEEMKALDRTNTIQLLEITKKYGFPGNERLGVYKAKAYMIFVHSGSEFFSEIRKIIQKEFELKNISEYQKEYIFWHLNGRERMPPMRGENGEVIWN